MGSDRARITYDASRQYRRVISQQGRVVVEADLNEAGEIVAEERRHELLDLIGPVGVPHEAESAQPRSGYSVGPANEGDFTIGEGAFYVGGLRVVQNRHDLTFAGQTEGVEKSWLEGVFGDVDWDQGDALVLLYLREQEVGAVEDPTLADIALGGPDTAQRARLLKRVVLARVEGPDRAFEHAIERIGRRIVFDRREMRMARRSRLRVNGTPEGAGGEPRAFVKNNYLGSENQLVRVQISKGRSAFASAGALERPRTRILWGYDNASALYRVDADDATTLTLRSPPVDTHHYPRKGQVVEVIEHTARLGKAEDEAVIAAPCGVTYKLEKPYDPDRRKIVLPSALPEVLLAKGTPLFVRIWVNEQDFRSEVALPLVDENNQPIGVDVTLSSEAPPVTSQEVEAEGGETSRFVPGDFWCFAVRPASPTLVDPARFARPQPPDGPREWLCPLALHLRAGHEIVDLRPTFEPLAAENAPLRVTPAYVRREQSLQSTVDAAVLRNRVRGQRATIRLEPGVYDLRGPLRLGPEHSDLTLEGTGEGVVLRAHPEHKGFEFHEGIIVVSGARSVTLRGLIFEMPWSLTHRPWFGQEELKRHRIHHELRVAVGVRSVNTTDLSILGCTFRFREPPPRHPIFGAAVFAGAACRRFSLRGCHVVMPPSPERTPVERLVYGYFLGPSRSEAEDDLRTVSPQLHDASFHGNTFAGVTAAVVARADIGTVRIDGNDVTHAEGGFWLFSLGTRSLSAWLVRRKSSETELVRHIFVEDERLHRSAAIAYLYRVDGDPGTLATMARTINDGVKAVADAVELIISWVEGRLHQEERLHEKRPARRFTLHVTNNRVDTCATERSGSALLVSNTDPDCLSSIVVSANDFETDSRSVPTASAFFTGRALVTGNALVNHAQDHGYGLVLLPLRDGGNIDAVAVTGNVIEGKLLLPGRPHKLPDWSNYNDAR